MQEGVGYRVESIASRESGFQGTRGDTPSSSLPRQHSFRLIPTVMLIDDKSGGGFTRYARFFVTLRALIHSLFFNSCRERESESEEKSILVIAVDEKAVDLRFSFASLGSKTKLRTMR